MSDPDGIQLLFPVLVLTVVALSVVVGMLVLAHLLGPRRDSPVKQMPYESGMDPIGDARGRFDIRYYLLAIVFLIFDVELLFLYPWAASAFKEGGPLAGSTVVFTEMMVFILLLALAYVYAWRKGVFEWRQRQDGNLKVRREK